MPTPPFLGLDSSFVRSQFPGLESGGLEGDWAFFDNAGGSFPVRGVVEAVAEHLQRYPLQLGATYPGSAEAAARVESGRRAAARLIGADPGEVVLGSSTTLNALNLSRALSHDLEIGDEIVVTNLDHEANVGAWRRLADQGVVIREWAFDGEAQSLRVEDLDPLLGERTRLVCCTHCSNLLGGFTDVCAVVERAHAAGALVCIDGVAFAPHRRVDVHALGVDFYLLSLYKVYGPHQGLLYVRQDLFGSLTNLNHYFLDLEPGAHRLQPGNVNYELTSSLPAIVDYLEGLDAGGDADGDPLSRAFARIAEREQALVKPLVAFLVDHPRIRLFGPPTANAAQRAPTLSFSVDGMASREVVAALERDRIATRYGHFYAHRAVQALGLDPEDGVSRVSLLHYNTEEEVARVIRCLDRLLATAVTVPASGKATSRSVE